MSKSRYFSLTTYATEKQIQKVLQGHISSLRAFCYIYHDKDEVEPHYHILMRTHGTWTAPQIVKWFADLKDKGKQKVNTFCEIASDMEALKKYILHDTDEAREAGKHQYTMADIKDFGYCDLGERKDCYDSSYEILEKVLLGVSPLTLVRTYGRDYLYHINQYSECADKVRAYQSMERYRELERDRELSSRGFKNVTDMSDEELQEVMNFDD